MGLMNKIKGAYVSREMKKISEKFQKSSKLSHQELADMLTGEDSPLEGFERFCSVAAAVVYHVGKIAYLLRTNPRLSASFGPFLKVLMAKLGEVVSAVGDVSEDVLNNEDMLYHVKEIFAAFSGERASDEEPEKKAEGRGKIKGDKASKLEAYKNLLKQIQDEDLDAINMVVLESAIKDPAVPAEMKKILKKVWSLLMTAA